MSIDIVHQEGRETSRRETIMRKAISKNIALSAALVAGGILGFLFLFLGKSIFASTTDGTVDSTYKYAWSENAGWINFGCSDCNVHITDSELTGYAWGENIGWISLNCSNDNSCSTVDYKVSNDGQGNLSGYAWSENAGWINFNPTYGGVSIDSAGNFLGYAWGENIGWIVFNCLNTDSCQSVDYKVKTDWRPQGVRPACNNAIDDDGDGKVDYPDDPGCSSLNDNDETNGGVPPEMFRLPRPPAGGFRVTINEGKESAERSTVVLSLSGGPDAARMAISNSPDFKEEESSGQVPYSASYRWDLCRGRQQCKEGKYTVFVKFFTQWGRASEVVSDSILYKPAAETEKGRTDYEGKLVRANNGYKVYVIKGKFRRWIQSSKIIKFYGHLRALDIKVVPYDVLRLYKPSALVRVKGDPKVWEINGDGTKHWLDMTAEEFTASGRKWEAVYVVNQKEIDYYRTGPAVKFTGSR